MASNTQNGFGSSASQTISGGALEFCARVVQSSSPGRILVTMINVAVLQVAGTFSANSYTPLYVMRGPRSSVPINGQDTTLLGMPTQKQLADAGFTLLHTHYFSTQNPAPLTFDNEELYAENGDVLMIVASPLIIGSTSPPSIQSNTLTLTVLGIEKNSVIRTTAR